MEGLMAKPWGNWVLQTSLPFPYHHDISTQERNTENYPRSLVLEAMCRCPNAMEALGIVLTIR